MAALTLVDMAKATSSMEETKLYSLFGGFSEDSDTGTYAPKPTIRNTMPWIGKRRGSGSSFSWRNLASIQKASARGLNQTVTPQTPTTEILTKNLKIFSSAIEIDQAMIDLDGMQVYQDAVEASIPGLAETWTQSIFKGDESADPNTFTGLQNDSVVQANQIQTVTSANGGPLSLTVLDRALNEAKNPTHLIMSRAMYRRMVAAGKTQTVAGEIQFSLSQFGVGPTQYGQLPILIATDVADNDTILPFTERRGNNVNTTSMYVVSFGEEGLHCRYLISPEGSMFFRRNQSISANLTNIADRFEMHTNWVSRYPKSVIRIAGITDAAITA